LVNWPLSRGYFGSWGRVFSGRFRCGELAVAERLNKIEHLDRPLVAVVERWPLVEDRLSKSTNLTK